MKCLIFKMDFNDNFCQLNCQFATLRLTNLKRQDLTQLCKCPHIYPCLYLRSYLCFHLYLFLSSYLSILFHSFLPALPLSRCPSGLEARGREKVSQPFELPECPLEYPFGHSAAEWWRKKERQTQVVLGGGVTVVVECKRISQCQIPIKSTDMSKKSKDRLRDPTLWVTMRDHATYQTYL